MSFDNINTRINRQMADTGKQIKEEINNLANITLKDYDTVVAVTQNAINQTMAMYLKQLQKQVALYYKNNADGEIVPAPNEESADYIFTGTLDFTTDAQGIPVNIVNLYTDGGNQTVEYNVTFKEAEYTTWIMENHQAVKKTYRQNDSANPWIFRFKVTLALQPAAMEKLPPDIRHKVEQYVKNLGPDMFSIQQLHMDLNTAVFDSYQNITGVPTSAMGSLSTIIQLYLKTQQDHGDILLGVNTRLKDSAGKKSTFMPTDLNFCVTPYLDARGNRSNPGLDTLNYLVMTGGRSMPAYPPKSFPFDWVSDTSIQGAMAVRSKLVVPFLVEKFNPLLTLLTPTLDINPDSNSRKFQLIPGKTNRQFTPVTPTAANNYQVAAYSYLTSEKKDGNSIYTARTGSASYKTNVSIYIRDNRIILHGSIIISAKYETMSTSASTGPFSPKPVTDTYKMPETTYNWSLSLGLSMNLNNNGELKLMVIDKDLDSEPVVKKEDHSGWLAFLEALAGITRYFLDDLSDLRTQVLTDIESKIARQVTSGLGSTSHFIFPGGRTFAFKNPTLTASRDLAANITYLSPTT